ncbi:SPW repeat protein [Hymenobacter volaticus]|uniref:Uncharacterized protein n=1 Tax=Hymenobacter volaticus TaxID=2932254 RepID=A0ABY4GA16_9BACT|nr:SPW repeat protein [Hymenobacter volaticus]UOQ67631.1 hypothetical protein MUN86_07140 [Hymenobacter volaticus]
MNQPISRQLHGFSDLSYVPLALALPKLGGFEDEDKAVAVTRFLAGNVATVGLFTRAEWGAVKKIPFKAHLLLDIGAGVIAAASPWLFGFADNKKARNGLLLLGAVNIMAGALSRPEEMPEGTY